MTRRATLASARRNTTARIRTLSAAAIVPATLRSAVTSAGPTKKCVTGSRELPQLHAAFVPGGFGFRVTEDIRGRIFEVM